NRFRRGRSDPSHRVLRLPQTLVLSGGRAPPETPDGRLRGVSQGGRGDGLSIPGFYANPPLSGEDPSPGLPAFEPDAGHLTRVYRRGGDPDVSGDGGVLPFRLLRGAGMGGGLHGEGQVQARGG